MAPPQRGSKPGERRGGRTKGTPNKQTIAKVARAKASGLLPHEFLLAVSQGKVIDGHTPTFAERVDCANKAAPYYAGKLSSITLHGANEDGSFTFRTILNGADARA